MFYGNTLAIVLKKNETRDTDLDFVFFTKKFGKLNVFAQGARKINAKLSGHLLLGNFVNLEIVVKSKPRLIGAELIDDFFYLRKNDFALWKMLSDLDFFGRLIVSPEKDLKIWNLLLNYLRVVNFLSRKKASDNYILLASLFLKINLIDLLGYFPSLEEIKKIKDFSIFQKKIIYFLFQKRNFSELFVDNSEREKSFKKNNLEKLDFQIKKYFSKNISYLNI